MLLLSRLSELEEQIMAQIRTITSFMATVAGVDDRILRDVGLDAEGNVVDEHDPRVRRLGSRRGFVERLFALLSMPGIVLLQRN
jgi:hypothetical protein